LLTFTSLPACFVKLLALSLLQRSQQAEENRLSELPQQNDAEEGALMALASGGLGDTTDEEGNGGLM
jgi:hypothetical protein